MRRIVLSVLACMLASTMAPIVQPVAAAATAAVVDPFDAAPPTWFVRGGKATLATSTTTTSGTGSLSVSYDFSAGNVSLDPVATPNPLPFSAVRSVSLDVYGDGTYNGVYIRFRDATGEWLMYRVGAIGFKGWQTLTVNLSAPPAAHDLGNNDGILDAPFSVDELILARNGSQPATGKFLIDSLRLVDGGWPLPVASSRVFVPSAGDTTTIGWTPTTAGDYKLRLTDGAGSPRTFTGTAAAGQPIAIKWDGKLDSGAVARGNVRGVLTYDGSPDRVLGTPAAVAAVPYLTGAAARRESSTPGSIVGVNSFLTTITSPIEVDRQAQLEEDAYVRMAREEFEWKRVEPRKGSYDWGKFDQAVEIARSHNIQLLGKLCYTATWASSAPAGTNPAYVGYYPPKNTSDYASYVRAVVHRYKDRVHVWEIWNEENAATFWRPAPSPAAYASLLKAAYAAIKQEDPTATVVLGGLAGFDIPFMDGLRAAGAWNSFDALGLHTYTAGAPETGENNRWLEKASAYLERFGTKPIWITEVGWSTYTGSGTGYIGVSEAAQADYLSRSYLDSAARGVKGLFWYNLIEDNTSTTSLGGNYGLVEQTGRQKPAYGALKKVAAVLDQAVSAGPAAPTLGAAAVADSGSRVSSWTSVNLGTAWTKLSTGTFARSGTSSIRLDYSFPGASDGVELRPNLLLPGSPTAVSLWVFGDRSAASVYLKLQDASGEYWQGGVGSAGVARWQRETLYTDGYTANFKHWGGDNNGVMNYPLTLRSVYVYRGTLGVTSGTIYFDDITAHYGANVRGVDLVGNTWSSQALWHLPSAVAVKVPVADSAAYTQSVGSYTSVPVSAGAASVTLSPTPTYLVTHAGLSASTLTPNGDGVGDTVTFSWIGGDRARPTVGVYTSAGLLQTLLPLQTLDANLWRVTWDGRYKDAAGVTRTAPVGRYELRLTMTGPDGRVGVISRSVSLS